MERHASSGKAIALLVFGAVLMTLALLGCLGLMDALQTRACHHQYEASTAVSLASVASGRDLVGRVVRVRGRVTSSEAVPSPIDGKVVVYASERVYHHIPAHGSRNSRKSSTDELQWSHELTPSAVELEDAGARVRVAGQATWEVPQATVQPLREVDGWVQVGDLRIPAPIAHAPQLELRRTIVEEGAQVVVMGLLQREAGELQLAKPPTGVLVATPLTDEQLGVRLRERSEAWWHVPCVVFGLLGLACVFLVRYARRAAPQAS